MEIVGTRRVYAAGDLVDFIACGHLATLSHAVASGERVRPAPAEEERLVAHKGDLHEAAHLERLRAAGLRIVDIPRGGTFESRREAARATLAAMRAGADVVHGATFVDLPAAGDGWLGIADFAIRTEGASQFGDYHYEIWDAKLARSAKPSAIVQMCVYAELLARAQGVLPTRVHAILGDGRVETFKTDDALPYVRAARERFVERMRADAATYPEPVAQCARCRWLDSVCEPRRRADDHLSLVANIRRSQIVKLHAAGIATVAQLAASSDEKRPRKLESTTFERTRAQAALQVRGRTDGTPRYELLKPEPDRGFARLPAPDPGDLYFDMEGDPFYDGGLEYLFGVASVDAAGERRFDSFDGHDRAGEKRAFEAFVDFVFARRALHPKLHVYHYASYEATALKRLAAQHGTREREVDVLLREQVLVDLYDVVRQALRASFESYSLKKIEQFFRGKREEEVTSAIGSVVMYERYLETRDPHELEEIVRYNREDCYSTLALHRWLLERRDEAEREFGVAIPHREIPEEAAPADDAGLEGLAASLAAGIDPETKDPNERARWLAAQLLVYHRREAKPAWWAFFARFDKSPDELIDDGEAIGGLTPLDEQPELFKKSEVFTLAFPPQEHKLKPGIVFAPNTGRDRSAGTLESIDDDAGTLRLKRGPSLRDVALPLALMPGKPIPNDKQRAALASFARELERDDCAAHFAAGRDLLRRDPPRLVDRMPGAILDDGATTPEKLAGLVLALDRSYLFVQGPPGAGKTYTGARALVQLIERGLRVGVASTSHKAIHHLLGEIERVAQARGVAFRGLKKMTTGSPESAYTSVTGAIESTPETAPCAIRGEISLVAGTAWLFGDEAMRESLDVLAIDEAGQVSLADAIAMSTAAKNVLLLGDPMQLAQVAQGQHPAGAEASVLAHLLDGAATVHPARGLFLRNSFRMHDSICAFVSKLAYDGRLEADPACANRRIDAGAISGAGLRYLPVPHEGNVQSSIEEAEAIAIAVGDLLRSGTVTDERGASEPLTERHVLVVTPYNAQVRRIRSALAADGFEHVRVGTVDKFQGQEAPVVFFSMASSRGDEVPRGIDFLFDRHRLNVAISRAQALAVLVCAPALLETQANSVPQLSTIGALCRFAQEAGPLRGAHDPNPEQLRLMMA
jgi:uncharacterized protein